MLANEKHCLPGDKKKVIILEDSRYEALGMVTELNNAEDIELIAVSADPDELLALAKQHGPHVAFIDLKIQGDINVGARIIRELKRIDPNIKCIVLTAFPELPNFLAAFDAGAEGFITKEAVTPQPSLAELVRTIKQGGRYYDPDLIGQMRRYLDETRLPVIKKDKTGYERIPLTRREQEILPELAKRRTNAEIAKKFVINLSTVKTHIRNIIIKLGAKDRHEAVLIAMSKGWLNDPPPE